MPTGPDGDEELALQLEELEAELESDEGPAGGPPPSPADLPEMPAWEVATVAGDPPFEEAAAEDARADAALYEREATAQPDAAHRAALWLEVARLADAALG